MTFQGACTVAICLFLAGCSIPDVSTELGTVDKAVKATAKDYRTAFGINSKTQRNDLIEAAVANRTVVVDLTEGCEGQAARVPGAQNCDIDTSRLRTSEQSLGRADQQLDMISNYISALETLANARTDAAIATASGNMVSALNGLSKGASGRGSSKFVKELLNKKKGIGKAASYAARQYQHRQLRKAITRGHAPLERLVLNLRDIAIANGATSRQEAFFTLEEFSDHADDMRKNGTNAQYRDALKDLYKARDAYVGFDETSLIPRLDRLVRVHGALRDRVRKDASVEEIATMLEDLKDLEKSL